MGLEHARKMMTSRLVASLYTEAMLLADEARGYFDEFGRAERDTLQPFERVAFSCESLKVTTRLMHVIAWLLTRKAIEAGEIADEGSAADSRRLGLAIDSDGDSVAALPERAREIVAASVDLYGRVARIDQDMVKPEADSPALSLIRRLERAL